MIFSTLRNCRICYLDDKEGKIISPCKCKGSLEYIHIDCLYYTKKKYLKKDKALTDFKCEICLN